MLTRHITVSMVHAVLLTAALAQQPEPGSTDLDPWSAPPIDMATAVFDGRTGEPVAFDAMLDALAEADAVFLGETHTDETTHRVELAVYEGLLERRDNRVVLAMEMFERDVQSVLNHYVRGEIDEDGFLAQARPWGQYRAAYRPLIERARADRLPVVASNFPRPLVRRVGMEGLGVLGTLEGDARRQAPAEILPNTPEYWRRVDNAVRGHLAMMPPGKPGDERLDSTQTLWDNAMGESCAVALDEHPGSMVLHVNGAFHSAFHDGAVHQLALRKPDARILTVDVTPTRHPAVAGVDSTTKPVADFVVYAESRATDEYEGKLTVALDRTLGYRLHLPDNASETDPVPLLIWLAPDGLTSQDGLDLWADRLGDEAAIAVIEPPYRARMPDLSEGGRWYWPDVFVEDIASAVMATERAWAYLLRNHPIDPARVVVAGEGTGATVAAAIALQGDRMSHAALAFGPRRYAKLKDFPLPLPEYRADEREVVLMVFGTPGDDAWWSGELAEYRAIGAHGSFETLATERDTHEEDELRQALGLPASDRNVTGSALALNAPADTARARHWARLYALRQSAETGRPVTLVKSDAPTPSTGEDDVLVLSITPGAVAGALPRCPGPFGGTTVIVLPEDVTETDAQAWLELEANDPINAASRFHRLRIALAGTDAPDRSLPGVLAKLESEGRKNVLIVPAEFCAGPITMQDLERRARDATDRMTIHWLPGLGQNLPISEE